MVLKKSIVIVSYVLAAALLVYYRSSLMIWMESDLEWYQNVFIGLVGLIIAIVPALPYGIVAAALGAKYGLVAGTLLNVTISVLGAMILFALVRRTFSEEGRAKAAKFKGLRHLTEYTERNAFMTIFFARMLPFIPAQAVNVFAALTKISWGPYLFATVLGKLPFITFVTLVGDRFIQSANIYELMIITVCYVIFLIFVYGVYRLFATSRSSGSRNNAK